MVKFLSKELNVRVEAYNFDAQTKPWLSINSGDPQITEDLSVRHLAETLVHLYDGGFCWVLKGKFKGAVFDIVIENNYSKYCHE
jgi:hypothetical protein